MAAGTGFRLFGPIHLTILAAVPIAAALLARTVRRRPALGKPLRMALAWFLVANELIWYGYRYSTEGFRFPEGLPLQLCDVAVWLTAAALFTGRSRVFEPAYFIGVAGAGMALLTPDLWAPLASYPSIYFFLAHGVIVMGLLYLVWAGVARLEPGCVWRGLLLVNAFAAIAGLFNAVFKTNYMYLCRKPASASMLDWFGPWPWYLFPGEVLALALFWLLWLPFRQRPGVA